MYRAIELRAAKLSGFMLAFVVTAWTLTAMYAVPFLNLQGNGGKADIDAWTISVPAALKAIHLLFAGFVFANIAYYGGIIAGYRELSVG